MMLKPPLHQTHIPASQGWYVVFPLELLNDGGMDLTKEPVVAWRLETFEIQNSRSYLPGDRFDSITPIIASGSISDVCNLRPSIRQKLLYGQWRQLRDERRVA